MLNSPSTQLKWAYFPHYFSLFQQIAFPNLGLPKHLVFQFVDYPTPILSFMSCFFPCTRNEQKHTLLLAQKSRTAFLCVSILWVLPKNKSLTLSYVLSKGPLLLGANHSGHISFPEVVICPGIALGTSNFDTVLLVRTSFYHEPILPSSEQVSSCQDVSCWQAQASQWLPFKSEVLVLKEKKSPIQALLVSFSWEQIELIAHSQMKEENI